ncbi:MAG TPA: thioredoxin fold domain-containing protein [Candidatus Acidoferrum sp.]|nr:thioredoxin fold domain-containing protein [Candidatus Acidoferrum sp.]
MTIREQDMVRTVSLILACSALVILISCNEKPTSPRQQNVARDTVHWVGSEIAYDTSITKKDFTMMLFSATWCGWCKKLKRETLTDTTVVRILNDSFNCVCIEEDADSLVRYKDTLVSPEYLASDIFAVTGYPTIYFLDRAGVCMSSLIGYRPAGTLAGELESFLANH